MASKVLVVVAALLPFCVAIPAEVFRPCRLDDYECIGAILQANSKCDVRGVKGYIRQEFEVPELHFEAPFFNASYIDRNLITRNFNRCFVSEFYINGATGAAVLGIDCPDKDQESNRVLIQHRSLREDSVFNFRYRGIYPLVRMTTVMQANNMDLCNPRVLTEVLGLPNLLITPQDEPTANFLSTDLTLLNVYETENFYFRGPALVRGFVKSLLCQYPCDVAPGIPDLP